MVTELMQFAGVVAGFAVVALVWVLVVFLPGRTMERWEDQRPSRRDESPRDPIGSGPRP